MSSRETAPENASETEPTYPRHWEADVLLRDGHTAHLRPISGDDEELLVEFYSQVSAESKYLRFFAPMPTLSERDVKRFTHVDHDHRVLHVLEHGGIGERRELRDLLADEKPGVDRQQGGEGHRDGGQVGRRQAEVARQAGNAAWAASSAARASAAPLSGRSPPPSRLVPR